MTEIQNLLQKTSRTFALTIPFLPQPTRAEVEVAYLLFRIVDTFEDGALWTPRRRIDALGRFIELLASDPAAAAPLVAECAAEPPVARTDYMDLLAEMPLVLSSLAALRLPARAAIRRHVTRSAVGMATFIRRAGGDGTLALQTIRDLREYCYCVAGIVGEMLTELYLLGRPALAGVAKELESRAVAFGEGLQLVNILKDAQRDAEEGRTYLPRRAPLSEVVALAANDLATATEYVDLLTSAGAESGLVAFNSSISKLALANLQILRDRGLGAKLSRLQVAQIQAEVLRSALGSTGYESSIGAVSTHE
ncbi:MAG TPA: squalene/phytoene synthase family protein [Polyangia bacterium]|jgi:farnesyl-diphosphate farnesyltransferase|nr:squalene/phytoene synthase family protein [Polyangia bacterium]